MFTDKKLQQLENGSVNLSTIFQEYSIQIINFALIWPQIDFHISFIRVWDRPERTH